MLIDNTLVLRVITISLFLFNSVVHIISFNVTILAEAFIFSSVVLINFKAKEKSKDALSCHGDIRTVNPLYLLTSRPKYFQYGIDLFFQQNINHLIQ